MSWMEFNTGYVFIKRNIIMNGFLEFVLWLLTDLLLAMGIATLPSFFGIFCLFLVSALLIFRGIKTAKEADDFFSFLLASGITLVYGIQTVINAMVVSGSIPPTGLPLPLISSGNTSLIITMGSMGILYAVSKKNARTARGNG